MTPLATFGRRASATLLCLSLVIWSVTPAMSHAPTSFETIEGHLELIAEHGHSHGFEEDLTWAMHGHGHDAADHDHGQALAVPGDRNHSASVYRDAWRLKASPGGAHWTFRIERPPRA
ncbi:hypothetical protein SAMN05444370_13424 [Rubrimonas cliftonensis]|uniref:Uncharacterized protein n=2 Tax=Rubrimonas cliftonensis TaxID=89524 RepID=A0A1H4G2Q8_9RHOB|nr:hypothetical protein SAMN05444370_13424 [Rubrimonas cliftonensis]